MMTGEVEYDNLKYGQKEMLRKIDNETYIEGSRKLNNFPPTFKRMYLARQYSFYRIIYDITAKNDCTNWGFFEDVAENIC